MTSDAKKTVVLGPEWDAELRMELLDLLREMGAEIADHDWMLGGSQELQTLKLSVNGLVLVVEAETYIGLKVIGPPELVDDISARLASAKGSTQQGG